MKAEQVWEEIVRIAEYCNQRTSEGWLLVDENGEIEDRKWHFEGCDNSKGLSLRQEKSGGGTVFLQYGETFTHGQTTLLQEYKEALKALKKYKLFEPKQVHSL
jgi:hypothetical protein